MTVLHDVVATTNAEGFRIGLLVTTFGFGFRHGIDWDHIAAITDITGSQTTRRTSMVFATLYALGHGLVVFGLGFAAIVLSEQLPSGIDGVMERVVGVTLLLLGVYVIVSLARQGRDFRMRSRWMLLFAATRRAVRWLRPGRQGDLVVIDHDHEHPADTHHGADHALVAATSASSAARVAVRETHRHGHRHIAVAPEDPFMNYGKATAFGVGMLHGIGAETPTQVLLFVAAAGAGGKGAGLLLLVSFLAGLLSSNSLIALASTFGFLGASRNFRVYVTVSVVTAAFSLAIGSLFVLGRGAVLPAIFGG